MYRYCAFTYRHNNNYTAVEIPPLLILMKTVLFFTSPSSERVHHTNSPRQYYSSSHYKGPSMPEMVFLGALHIYTSTNTYDKMSVFFCFKMRDSLSSSDSQSSITRKWYNICLLYSRVLCYLRLPSLVRWVDT